MSVTTQLSPPPDEESESRRRLRLRRVVAMSIWAAAFVTCWVVLGLPTEPIYQMTWVWSATIAWRSHLPWRAHLEFARDWGPILGLLVIYTLSRGAADATAPHVTELIHADEWLVGWLIDGQVPTVWLQEHLYDPDRIYWWDMLASWVYFSHFVVAITVAVVFWLRNRTRWAAFIRRFLFLCVLGLATYFAYPAAPPWWAHQEGYLSEVARISTRGWRELGLHSAFNMLNESQLAVNPVAAMPSLHAAWSLLVVAFFLPSVRRRWWPLLLAYPLAMAFTLMYTGEHYLIDILVGWAYVGVVFLVIGIAERRGWMSWWPRVVDKPADVADKPTDKTVGKPAAQPVDAPG